VVEVVFDEGRLLAAGSSQRIREMEFALLSGSASAMLALAERWRKRFGLILDPRSKSARGDRLADGSQFPAVRKASLPDYPRRSDAAAAWRAVLDECLAQISLNAIGIAAGDPKLIDDHVHQLRVGIRRLRSALRSFGGWVAPPPKPLVDELRTLFATLGASRDSTVLDSGVVLELARVGAPTLMTLPKVSAPDPAEAVRSNATQRLLLAWIAWRETLQEGSRSNADVEPERVDDAASTDPAEAVEQTALEVAEPAEGPLVQTSDAPLDTEAFHRLIERRLRQWHRRIANKAKMFDELDEEALHELRKRIKRQRYTVEFFAPVMKRRSVARYLGTLAVIQDRMGGLNDLFVARARFQELIASDPAAWFALGWLAARIAETRALARPELIAFAKTELPSIA
jgi:CHAD domain-containing protein